MTGIRTSSAKDNPLNAQVTQWLERLNDALSGASPGKAANLFDQSGYWRDILALTWNVKTLEGRDSIARMLDSCQPHSCLGNFQLVGDASEVENGAIEAVVRFDTRQMRGRGVARLSGNLAIALLTMGDELKEHEVRAGDRRRLGLVHGAVRNRRTWLAEREEVTAGIGREFQPYVLIVGGGQAGLALGARLGQLEVPTLIVERNPRAGDSWRNRYRTLVLHDPVWYDHLPFLPFPDHWPVFTPKDKMGDWLEAYAKIMELNFWGSSNCTGASYDDGRKRWTVSVERNGDTLTLHPRQLVLCTGAYGLPRIPEFDDAHRFAGTIMHSSRYQTGEIGKGRRCVVVGSNTSAHDICADLWESGAERVTMIQRSPTTVVSSDALMEIVFKGLYSESAVAGGISTERADMMFASMSMAALEERQRQATREMKALDAELLGRLKAAGFLLDDGADGTGLVMKAFRTGSGYYIDVGCSELIAQGEVKVRSGVEPVGFTRNAVRLSDGQCIGADLVVYATGYLTLQDTIRRLISGEVAERIGHCWGYGSGVVGDPGPWQGETRNLWKPTSQEALWLHGGNLHLSRFFSKFVALQLKARMEGLQTPVYGGPS